MNNAIPLNYEDLVSVVPQLIEPPKELETYYKEIKPLLEECVVFESFNEYLVQRLQYCVIRNDFMLINFINKNLNIERILERYHLTEEEMVRKILESTMVLPDKKILITHLLTKMDFLKCLDVMFQFDQCFVSSFEYKTQVKYCIDNFGQVKSTIQIINFMLQPKGYEYQSTSHNYFKFKNQQLDQAFVFSCLLNSDLTTDCEKIMTECNLTFDKMRASINEASEERFLQKIMYHNYFGLSLDQRFKLCMQYQSGKFADQLIETQKISLEDQILMVLNSGLTISEIIDFCCSKDYPIKLTIQLAIQNESDMKLVNSFKTLMEITMMEKVSNVHKMVEQANDRLQQLKCKFVEEIDSMLMIQ